MRKICRSRLAPTPSGYLHLGNAVNFILTWLEVKKQHGTLALRIDDMDTQRLRPEYTQDIFDSLHWLGLDWDHGPRSPEDFNAHHSQRLRLEIYREWFKKLQSIPQASFTCTCSRTQVAGNYPGTCREKNLPWQIDKTKIRLRFNHPRMQDFVLWRKDDLPAYQLTSLVDDHLMGINLVVRGQDLQDSTEAQLFLARMLGLKDFSDASFYHHPLLLDEQGAKLSKSCGATSLKYLRERGTHVSAVYTQVAKLLGIALDKQATLTELLHAYSQLPDSWLFSAHHA